MSTIVRYPRGVDEVGKATVRAGAIDLAERARHLPPAEVADLRDVAGLADVEVAGALRVGAMVTLADLAAHPQVVAGWSGVAKAAGALATPEVRAAATLGGNLAQHTRCWYYRNPLFACLKKGGATCFAREGDHVFHALFDRSPCASVHASTMGCALLTYDTTVEVALGAERRLLTLEEILGEGKDARRHNGLPDGAVITRVEVAPTGAGEKTAYFRAISRARAEWPLVEVSLRLGAGGWRVAVGGVAGVPLRLPAVEKALDAGEAADKAVARSVEGASPLPGTRYKLTLLPRTLLAALELVA